MSTASYGRSRSGDRFYNPPQVRRQLQLRQQQQQQQEEVVVAAVVEDDNLEREEVRREKDHRQNHHRQRREKSPPTEVVVVEERERGEGKSDECDSSENRVESDDCDSSTATVTTVMHGGGSMSSSSLDSSPCSTNLDRFLEYTTPSVPAHYLSKTSMKEWRTQDDEFGLHFMLGDLWESFREWSAYGVGVPLVLHGHNSIVQYYVPYLSGIQLYMDSSKPFPRTRMPGNKGDESSRETSSAGSSDCETERRPCNYNAWNHQDPAGSNIQSMKGFSYKPFNGSSSDEGEFSSSSGSLTFEYFEHERPYCREPLADKIYLLASRFPELKTYRSCDLSPSSWISVAWYPIYRIPTGPTLQNLDSCFLTFHCLSTPLRGGPTEWQNGYDSCSGNTPNGIDIGLKIPLPIFGMASYKFKASVWDQSGLDESPKANSLLRAADEWLRLLNVNHPDYQFFASHNFN